MKYLRLLGIEKYQHYKDRNPPWVKLHCDILNSYTWTVLDNESRLLAIVCIVLASRTENRIPLDREYLRLQGRFKQRPDVRPLIEVGFAEVIEDGVVTGDASEVLADASNLRTNVRPETETETETKTKKVARRLAEEFIPKDSHYVLAKELGVIVDVEFPSFRDHFLGNGNTKVDWDRTFNNWLRNSLKYRSNGHGINGSNHQKQSAPSKAVSRWHNNSAELGDSSRDDLVAALAQAAGADQTSRLGAGSARVLEGEIKKLH